MKKTAIYQKKRSGHSVWYNKWVQSPRWFIGFWVVLVACLGLYVANLFLGTVSPSSRWGLGYGLAATAVLLAVVSYAGRRRTLGLRRLGKSWTYLQVHVYGGTLFILLVIMHTGFSWPSGVHTLWLYILSIWVVLSGLLGVAVQKWIPTVLTAGFPVEIHYSRAPELIDEIRRRCDKLASTASERVSAFYAKRVAPSLSGPRPQLMYFFDVTGGIHARTKPFAYLRELLPPEEGETLEELKRLYRSKLEIDAHYTLQRALRGWLLLHVPVSVLMLALLAFHIFSVIYY